MNLGLTKKPAIPVNISRKKRALCAAYAVNNRPLFYMYSKNHARYEESLNNVARNYVFLAPKYTKMWAPSFIWIHCGKLSALLGYVPKSLKERKEGKEVDWEEKRDKYIIVEESGNGWHRRGEKVIIRGEELDMALGERRPYNNSLFSYSFTVTRVYFITWHC